MNTFAVIIGSLGTVFAVVMTILAALSFRKHRKISALSILFSGILAAAALGMMIFLGGLRLKLLLALPLLLLGMLLGFLRGQTVHMQWQGTQVVGRNSILFLLMWGLSLAFGQLLGMLGSPLLASLGLVPAVFSTGLQLGFQGNLFLRRLAMRQQKPAGGLNTIIGIGGGLAIFLLLLVTLIAAVPTLVRTFPDFSFPVQAGSLNENSQTGMNLDLPIEEPASEQSGGPPSTGLLPSSGSLVLSCDAELQKELDGEENYGGMEGEEYSFEETFESYDASMEMQVNLNQRTFLYSFEEHWIKHDLLYNPDFDEEPCPLYFDQSHTAVGTVLEDGWIKGNLSSTTKTENCTGTIPDSGTNQFFGYMDDELSVVVFCPLPISSLIDPSDYAVDFSSLQQAGKDNLITNWWNPDMCRTCTIEQVLP